ncbi:MAG: class I SAM-dependent methyltransferase [Planctomycetes bacterium]|nr:class I SAM-dependent methyltransferase [Planctomycetota bacterium]
MVVGAGLQRRYGSAQGAAAYRHKYERSWLRRWSARREASLLRWALARAATSGEVLDVPCGAGRMAPVLLERAARVTGVDRSDAMVEQARDACADAVAAGRLALATGSADALPFPDGAFHTAVCWRLLHHVVDRDDRRRVLASLARVATGAVVATFCDATTWKARGERLRRRDRRCVTLAPAAFADEARAAGLVVEATRRLSSCFSLLAVAVCRRAGPAAG